MNVLIFDHHQRVISLQASPEWIRDLIYHKNSLSIKSEIAQSYLESRLMVYPQICQSNYKNTLQIASLKDSRALDCLPPNQLTHCSGHFGVIDHLAVIDFVNKKMISTHPDFGFNLSSYLIDEMMEFSGHCQLKHQKINAYTRLQEILQLFDENYLTIKPEGFFFVGDTDSKEVLDAYSKKIDHFLNLKSSPANLAQKTYHDNFTLNADTCSWKIHDRAGRSRNNTLRALEQILQCGFILSENQEKAWHSPSPIKIDSLDTLFVSIAREKALLLSGVESQNAAPPAYPPGASLSVSNVTNVSNVSNGGNNSNDTSPYSATKPPFKI